MCDIMKKTLRRNMMGKYSEQDLKYASELREEIHREALFKARALHPEINEVIDAHSVEDYFQQQWDYPGKWYTVVAIPYGYKSRQALVDKIVSDTVEHYLNNRADGVFDPFFSVISEYPDSIVDYAIVAAEKPYCDGKSHFSALMKGAGQIMADSWKINGGIAEISSKIITVGELFAPAAKNGVLNYRRAFLSPPHTNKYTDADFDRINAALFPNGTDGLEIYEWSTDWSDYFDDGHEWWGALCLSVYDKTLDRFVIIMASATD
jgi:hypothetical protein